MYKTSKWAKQILELQNDDGSWGYFHTLSEPKKFPLTTEQALRRLSILGYTIQDVAVFRAVAYMRECLAGTRQLPDRREKTHDWDTFTTLILSAWIRRFTLADDNANSTAEGWAEIITHAFSPGGYDQKRYVSAYRGVMKRDPFGARLLDFVSFYQVSLLAGLLNLKTQRLFVRHVLQADSGIYYIYGSKLSQLPRDFRSKDASRYLGAIELLAGYRGCLDELAFVAGWLLENRSGTGRWDMGAAVRDKVYFPLSDDWRKPGAREADCTFRVQALLERL